MEVENKRKEELNLIFGIYLVIAFVISTAFGFQLSGLRIPDYLSWMWPIAYMPFWLYNLFSTIGLVLLIFWIMEIKKSGGSKDD